MADFHLKANFLLNSLANRLSLSRADESPMKKMAQANGKKTKGRVKIKMEFIDNKLRRYTTFSKRKTGIMKKVRRFFCLRTLFATKVF